MEAKSVQHETALEKEIQVQPDEKDNDDNDNHSIESEYIVGSMQGNPQDIQVGLKAITMLTNAKNYVSE